MTAAPARHTAFWGDRPDAWETVYLGGRRVPALAEVEVERGRKLDVKSRPGSDGATIADKGYEPARVRITLTFDDREGYEMLLAMMPAQRPAGRRAPIELRHPALDIHRVERVYLEKVSGPRPGRVAQTMELVLQAVEFRPPSKGNGTVNHRKNDTAQPGASTRPGAVFNHLDGGQSRSSSAAPSPAPAPSATPPGPDDAPANAAIPTSGT